MRFYFKSKGDTRFMVSWDAFLSAELEMSRNHSVQPHYLALDSASNMLYLHHTFYQVIYKGLIFVKEYLGRLRNFIHQETKKCVVEISFKLNNQLTSQTTIRLSIFHESV